MGTDCHILVEAPEPVAGELLLLAQQRVELLEQCWSRFRNDSELSLLNARAGRGPIEVSPDLLLLVTRMREAWNLSEGLFDPTVLSAMAAHGYDADFAIVSARTAATAINVIPAPGMSGVLIDGSTVTLPANVGIDPGAIGKGLAADVIATELAATGARAVLVNLGGDLSVIGTLDEPWAFGIEDERRPSDDPDRILRVLEFPAGTDRIGVATSTTLKRRWAQGRRHHVIDPRTGTMGTSDLVQVTVIAAEAWQAEVLATTALLLPADDAATWIADRGHSAVLLTDNDDRHIEGGPRHG
jgi:thiamine biosynthesis lipoprotein